MTQVRTGDQSPHEATTGLSVAQVAARFQVSEVTVRRWIRNGDLPSVSLPGGRLLRIPTSALDGYDLGDQKSEVERLNARIDELKAELQAGLDELGLTVDQLPAAIEQFRDHLGDQIQHWLQAQAPDSISEETTG